MDRARRIRSFAVVVMGVVVVAGTVASRHVNVRSAEVASTASTPPVTLRSSHGVLEATLTASRGPVTIDGRSWNALLYNGAYLPPVLRVQPGDSLRLHFVNALPAGQTSNLHYHGTATAARAPGDYVMMTTRPGAAYDYQIHFPATHDRGLFWYHPHPHGLSEKQVQGGMSGLLVVEGLLEATYPWLTGTPERLLMLKDPEPPGRPDRLGHLKTLNGSTNAIFTIRPGELQFWRIGNIGADAYFNLKIEGHRFWLIASDANVRRRPVLLDSLFLPPGARAEVLIVGGTPGRYAIAHDSVNTGPQGDPNPSAPLGTLIVEGAPMNRSSDIARLEGISDLPGSTAEIDSLLRHPVTRRRTFTFSETADGNTFFINGAQFSMHVVNTTTRIGDVEEWTLVNSSREWHAFHIHQTDFLVTEINGVPQPADGLHDTVNLPYAVDGKPGVVKILIPFTNPDIAGTFVYHCHILEHEDGGMMGVIRVDPGRP